MIKNPPEYSRSGERFCECSHAVRLEGNVVEHATDVVLSDVDENEGFNTLTTISGRETETAELDRDM